MFARFTTIRGVADNLEALADRVDGKTRAEVESQPGNRGFAVLTDVPNGSLIGASYWNSADSLRSSEEALAASRQAAADVGRGSLRIERFEVALAFRHSYPARGALIRLARFTVDRAEAEDALVLAQEEVVPRVKRADGLQSFQVLIDREASAGMSITAWQNREAAHAFAPTAEQLRARASDRVGMVWQQPEDFTMVRTTVRLD